MSYQLTLEHDPSEEDIQVVQAGLNEYNAARSGRAVLQRLAAFVRDAQGQIVGGAIGWTWGEVADIRVVWMRDNLCGKGYGRQLMGMLEAEAVKRGCRVAVLDSYTFQASDFYRKLGYDAFGVIDGFPNQVSKLFLKKDLD